MSIMKDLKILAGLLLQELSVPICLVGMMGSGKTYVGKRLSKLLGVEFIDLDDEITKDNGSIKSIFRKYGEEYFRMLEVKVLKDILRGDSRLKIIALGGGAFINPVVREMLRLDNVISIFLNLDISVIYSRLQNDTKRPLLAGLTNEQKYDKIKDILELRREYYELANVNVEISQINKDNITEITMRKLFEYLENL